MKRITCRTFNKASGYWELYFSDGSRCWEHRYVMEQVLGRPLRGDEVVHHQNETKTDNRPENLVLMTQSAHAALHKSTGRTKETLTCSTCGVKFEREVRHTRHKRRKGQTDWFCSRRCNGLTNH